MEIIITTEDEYAADNGIWHSSIEPNVQLFMKQGEKFPKVNGERSAWRLILTIK